METLQVLKSKVKMGIITNGFSLPQRVPRQAGLERVVRAAGDLGRGTGDQAGGGHFPACPRADAAPGSGASADGGDNPKTDIAGAAAQGLATCWYNPARQDGPCEATHEIHHFAHLSAIVLGQ